MTITMEERSCNKDKARNKVNMIRLQFSNKHEVTKIKNGLLRVHFCLYVSAIFLRYLTAAKPVVSCLTEAPFSIYY